MMSLQLVHQLLSSLVYTWLVLLTAGTQAHFEMSSRTNVPKPLTDIYRDRSTSSWSPGGHWIDLAEEIQSQPYRGCHHKNNFQFGVEVGKISMEAEHIMGARMQFPRPDDSEGNSHEWKVVFHCRGATRYFAEVARARVEDTAVCLDVSRTIRQFFQHAKLLIRERGAISQMMHCRFRVSASNGTGTPSLESAKPIPCETRGSLGDQPSLILFFNKIINPIVSSLPDTDKPTRPTSRSVERTKRSSGIGARHWTAYLNKPCQLVQYSVNSSILNTRSLTLLQPQVLNLNMCVGECFFTRDRDKHTVHALLQSAMNFYGTNSGVHPELVMPSACCVPTQLASLTILSANQHGGITVATYNATLVTACGCR